MYSVTKGGTDDPDEIYIYTILGSSEDATEFFDGMLKSMENGIKLNDLDLTPTLETSDNYSKYTVKGDLGMGFNAYQVLIRVGNTTLQVGKKYTLESDIETADAIVSMLGF